MDDSSINVDWPEQLAAAVSTHQARLGLRGCKSVGKLADATLHEYQITLPALEARVILRSSIKKVPNEAQLVANFEWLAQQRDSVVSSW